MGFSVRSSSWRWTEWLQWNASSGQPEWSKVVAAELYDHRGDRGDDFDRFENENLANASGADFDEARQELSHALRQQFSAN